MQEIIRTLTWTFIHSLWQGLIAALLAAIVISSTRSATARLRYNLLGIIMILFFAASIMTFIIQWQTQANPVTPASFVFTGDAPVIHNTGGLMDNFIAWVNGNSDTIILAWTFFFLFSCLRLVTGLAAVNRLKHYKTQPVSNDWKSKLEQLQGVIGIRRPVSLLQSELVKIPMALGILKPVILLPLGLVTHLPPEQVETILLHELAHIRRRDYLVNLLQHIAESVFFFNPAMRWLSFLIRQEREACCDDMVVAGCNQKTNYFNALISFQEYSIRHSSYAMGISCKRHYLLNRVKRMITNKNKGISFFEKVFLLAGVILFSAFGLATQEKEEVKARLEEVKTTFAVVEQGSTLVSPAVAVPVAEQPPLKNDKKRIDRQKTAVRDTLPAKKDTLVKSNTLIREKSLTEPKDPKQAAADAKLQEIVDIKNQIGLKKESIGEKKEELKTADAQEKEKIQHEIDRERRELDDKRKILERKRAEWESLKKEAQNKPKEEKNPPVKTIPGDGRSPTIQKDNDGKTFGLKKKQISNDNNKSDNQEFQYKLDLQVKDPLPAPGWKVAPEKFSIPDEPVKKVRL